jgi:radical S-adenosyl methionine domain-containing protein 2
MRMKGTETSRGVFSLARQMFVVLVLCTSTLMLARIPSSEAFLPLMQSHRRHSCTSTGNRVSRRVSSGDEEGTPSISQEQQEHNTVPKEEIETSPVRSVNYFISRACNYSCKFCFHTQKNSHHLSLQQAVQGLHLLQQAGTEKINFAGGEPFLHPTFLGELCRVCHEDLGMAVSIISNGSLITEKWMLEYGKYVDVLGISVDSFIPETNAAIGRGGGEDVVHSHSNRNRAGNSNQHVERMLRVRDLCSVYHIQFKLNTVVCNWNWWEDMNERIRELEPVRWKVFQVLILQDENSGAPGELKDARPLIVSDDNFWSFVHRHQTAENQNILIPEPNNVMQNSYLLLDEELRFLDCSQGGKVPSASILQVGVEQALLQSGFDADMFEQRGGVYNWTRERDDKELIL